jgi:hypothetical protein
MMNNPYGTTAQAYVTAGWSAPLPLPLNAKFPPPAGTTGYNGQIPTEEQIIDWSATSSNIALRLPSHVVGIDVDNYNGKNGGQTLRNLEQRFGKLPATWTVTSRNDGVSGIRFFKASFSAHTLSSLGEGIDVIRYGHRYAVVWPSIHPSGDIYRWFDPNGHVTDAIPVVDDLPVLPMKWHMYLHIGNPQKSTTVNNKKATARDFIPKLGCPAVVFDASVDVAMTKLNESLAALMQVNSVPNTTK